MYYKKLLVMHSKGDIRLENSAGESVSTIDSTGTVFALLLAMIHADLPVENEMYQGTREYLIMHCKAISGHETSKIRNSSVDELLERFEWVCEAAGLLLEDEKPVPQTVGLERKDLMIQRLEELSENMRQLGKSAERQA